MYGTSFDRCSFHLIVWISLVLEALSAFPIKISTKMNHAKTGCGEWSGKNNQPQSLFSSLTRLICQSLKLRVTDVSLAARGFINGNAARSAYFEKIIQSFVEGYNAALEAYVAKEVRQSIETIQPGLRGFAAEGAAMGSAIRSCVPFSQCRLHSIIEEIKPDFDYLAHVGIGWAIARVPWKARTIRSMLDPIHHWLTYDGLGFHDFYFYHRQVLAGWRRGLTGYSARVYYQGVGRALWFVAGGSIIDAIGLIVSFPSVRHNDLWAGLGLAMAYAGPIDGEDVVTALNSATINRRHYAQGVAFACEAHVRAGHVPTHTVWLLELLLRARLQRSPRLCVTHARDYQTPMATCRDMNCGGKALRPQSRVRRGSGYDRSFASSRRESRHRFHRRRVVCVGAASRYLG